MAKYDWEKLKRKFITTSPKCTLKQFAIDNGIPYRTLRERAVGWVKERRARHQQKTGEIIDKTIDRQIESEVEMNLKHYDAGTKLLDLIDKACKVKEIACMPKAISSLATALEKAQKVQRIASGRDKEGDGKADVISKFMEAVINGNDTSNQ